MRRYTLVYMEQRIGVSGLTPVEGEAGSASFASMDDEEALAFINDQLLERLKQCARGELSSLRMVPDAGAPGGVRLLDDTHANPHFQDSYVRYNNRLNAAELDFDSTRTVLPGTLRSATG